MPAAQPVSVSVLRPTGSPAGREGAGADISPLICAVDAAPAERDGVLAANRAAQSTAKPPRPLP